MRSWVSELWEECWKVYRGVFGSSLYFIWNILSAQIPNFFHKETTGFTI